MRTRLTFSIVACIALTACSITHSQFDPPSVPRDSWRVAVDSRSGDALNWWQRLQDPTLNSLIEDALVRNNELAATANVARRSELLVQLAAHDRRPQPDGGVSAAATRAFDGPPTSKSFSAGIGVSYEFDLWNRLGALEDAAQWSAVASEHDRTALALAVAGTTASLYFQLGYLQERLALDEASLDVARRTLALVQVQYDAGSASSLELAEARRELLIQEAARIERMQEQFAIRNALQVVLDGRDVATFNASPIRPLAMPAIDAGTPAQLLARRPDLRAAEARLRAVLASVDALEAAFYPTISLTGEAGSASTALRDIVANPVGALATALALPFLNIERSRLTRAAARAEYDASVLTFKDTLQRALADVDNELSARQQLIERQSLLARALDNAGNAERIYELRYRAGAVALRDWLDAQEARRSVEADLLDNKLEQLTHYIALSQALGGDANAAP